MSRAGTKERPESKPPLAGQHTARRRHAQAASQSPRDFPETRRVTLPCSIMKYVPQTSDDIIDTDADDIPIAANRRVLVLRALRIGGLIAALPSMVLAVVW